MEKYYYKVMVEFFDGEIESSETLHFGSLEEAIAYHESLDNDCMSSIVTNDPAIRNYIAEDEQ